MGNHAPDRTGAERPCRKPSNWKRSIKKQQGRDDVHQSEDDKRFARMIKIIGAGLAGCEAAWQCARRDIEVELYEMRPVKSTPAHQTDKFAELVCSNSLKSESEHTAPWLLKEEMRRADSLLIKLARETAVPAGHALAVDRETFAAKVTEVLSAEPLIKVIREEVTHINENDGITVIAHRPLTY